MVTLRGAGVVITGAASGIGAGMAERFAEAGARLVVADRNELGLTKVAQRTGAIAVPVDLASDKDVRYLIDRATTELGGIDLYCSNAGVGGAESPDVGDSVWQNTFDVNVMAHVRAARYLLPAWLAGGSGHMLVTVSSAGMLTMPGSAGYSASKHAALGFTEWLAYTHAHRGITVQALCPDAVSTPMLLNSPLARFVIESGIVPDLTVLDVPQVVDAVMAGLATGEFLILPHEQTRPAYIQKATDTDAYLAAMGHVSETFQKLLAANGSPN